MKKPTQLVVFIILSTIIIAICASLVGLVASMTGGNAWTDATMTALFLVGGSAAYFGLQWSDRHRRRGGTEGSMRSLTTISIVVAILAMPVIPMRIEAQGFDSVTVALVLLVALAAVIAWAGIGRYNRS